MPNGEKKKKPNDIKDLRDPSALDVGPFGKANAFLDNFVSGWIYMTAIEELIAQEESIRKIIEEYKKMDNPEVQSLIAPLEAELEKVDEKWELACQMFGIDA